MKKLFAFISVFLMLSVSIFADVSVKKLDNGQYEVTFFYGNPRAAEVVIAGDFTNWQNGAEPMTKTDKGWTYTKVVPAGTTMKYKFISDGNWTADIKAPDTVDDGFGGLNGLVDVNVLGGGGAAPTGPKVKFLTWSMIEYQMMGNLSATDKSLDSASVGAYSYLKFTGDVLPHVPVYFEIAALENQRVGEGTDHNAYLYKKGSVSWADGLQNALVDLVCDPFYWISATDGTHSDDTAAVKGSGWAYLGHFKVGLSSDYVNWTYGAKYAKLPPHSINDWITIDKEWEAGYKAVGGYSAFELGSKLQNLPFGTLTASLIPNRSADREGNQYGMIGWVNLNCGQPASIDFQYNGAYGKTWDSIFGTVYEHDFILGYKGTFGGVTVKANGLVNVYGDGDCEYSDEGAKIKTKYVPASSDVGAVMSHPQSFMDNIAVEASVRYANDDLDVTGGARIRGAQANLMYVEEGADDHWNVSDTLGDPNFIRIYADANYNITPAFNLGVNPYVQMTWNKNTKSTHDQTDFTNKDTVKIYAKPYFTVDMDELAYIPGKLEGYAELKAYTTADDGCESVFGKASQFAIETAGLKYSQTFDNPVVKSFDVTYVFDNTNKATLFNYAYGTMKFAQDYGFQYGLGLRTANNGGTAPVNPFAFFVGATKKLPVLAKPTAYVQFMYAMNPYHKLQDGPTAYKLDDWKLKSHDDSAVDTYKENYALRVGLQWDL